MAEHIIIYEPVGRRGNCQEQESLLACARRLGIGINSICGGAGVCSTCKIRILDGIVSKPTANEVEAFTTEGLQAGWRLACQTYPQSNCKLYIPVESMTSPQRTQLEGIELKVPLAPPVKAYRLSLTEPSLADLRADAGRLLEEINRQAQPTCDILDIDVLRALSPQLRADSWDCQAIVRENEVIAVGSASDRRLGLAVDLGSTKIAAYLVDLSDGKTVTAKGAMNPQISYGEDIVSRITSAIKNPEDLLKMRDLAVEAINRLTAKMCREAGININEVVEAVVVGNTAMHHIFLGLAVKQLALPPFISAVNQPLDLKARDVGIKIAAGAYVHLLPNIAGFVGADHVAMLLATDVWQAKGFVLALDIGTNTEVSLVCNGRIASASCASGPAFEGGHIKDGMRAARGVIERMQIVGDTVHYQTIEGAPPVGICGSGIMDALAQLFKAGIIDKGGRMTADHPRVIINGKQREFVLVSKEERGGSPAITITQNDIRELQLAKAAIRAGIQMLLENQGKREDEIDRVIIAGAFGSYIDVASAITAGMLPALPLERFEQVGNAAGLGAKLALISVTKRAEAKGIAGMINYIELASAPHFNQTFIQANYLGKYRIANGKKEDL
ncbi:MAG: ASKHA domain-containing protein [Syntrophales bacterium]|jgi:uncharacterized 2Fe-2S/4Fe-4S cluster protein (DUF4445 family)|nr:ASKHA domain-containing protein [Syntrophales bacterium]